MTVLRDPEGVETKALLSHIDFAGKRVLEIGSGEGRLTARIAPHAGSYFGLDTDSERLEAAGELAAENPSANVPLTLADAIAMPYPTDQFDIALLAWSL